MKEITRNRARIEILNYIITFSTIKYYGNSQGIGQKDWAFESVEDSQLKKGDLISLSSAPFTKYYLSWFKEIKYGEGGWNSYLLESIEDGSLCWWSNVSLNRFSPTKVNDHDEWKWNDDQFEFSDKVKKAFRKFYSICYYPPKFNDDGSVEIKGRYKWTSDLSGSIVFPNYKKVLLRDVVNFLKSQNK